MSASPFLTDQFEKKIRDRQKDRQGDRKKTTDSWTGRQADRRTNGVGKLTMYQPPCYLPTMMSRYVGEKYRQTDDRTDGRLYNLTLHAVIAGGVYSQNRK